MINIKSVESNPDNSKLKVIKVGMGNRNVSNFETIDVLMTDKLRSCYGFIVIATKKGVPNNKIAVGLSHWVGDEEDAEHTVLDLKKLLLKSLYCKWGKVSFYCIAIGGGEECAAAKSLSDEVKNLKKSKEHPNNIFDEVICDTNKGSDIKSTSIFIQKINGEIEITYHTFSLKRMLQQQREQEGEQLNYTVAPKSNYEME